jgi:hypothetical protein
MGKHINCFNLCHYPCWISWSEPHYNMTPSAPKEWGSGVQLRNAGSKWSNTHFRIILFCFSVQPFDPGSDVGRVSSSLASGTSWSRLLIDRAETSHTGQYQCRPSNSAPASVHLTVLAGTVQLALQYRTVPDSTSADHPIQHLHQYTSQY